MFYDGNAQLEPGAVVCRVAPSFTRFGNFQIFAARGENETLRQLVDYTIRNDFPHLLSESEVIVNWFDEVCQSTADMIVHWMRVGFVHGVMNTDNMSILGLTIDYGPYGWLENYDPTWTPNTTDSTNRRYRFGNQPGIAHWNLYQLANAIVQLTEDPKPFEESLERYGEAYSEQYKSMMAAKLGLKCYSAETDEQLIGDLLEILQLTETDMTIFFRNLSGVSVETEAPGDEASILDPIRDAWAHWLRDYQRRVASDGTTDLLRQQNMNSVNPKYVLRNYMAQLAIDKSQKGDHSLVNDLLDVLRRPYDEQPGQEQHAEKRPEWARDRAGCSMLSCSS
ncbi:UNVERIFIED_CONTAM: hypothetical protein GTU68_058752 [Idotea baltica]|nr:hypothetical protein [Idotea baltica]